MIVQRAPKLLHPKCPTPGWWERRKLQVKIDDIWQCPECGIKYKWDYGVRGGNFWSTLFGESGKSLVVHYGYDPEVGMLALNKRDLAELVDLKNRFQVPR